MIQIQAIPVGTFIVANCYFLYDDETLEAAVIDPGDKGELLLSHAQNLGLKVRYLLLTHGHYDHVGALGALRAAYPEAQVYIHAGDVSDKLYQWGLMGFEGLRYYTEGDSLPFCGGEIKVYHTPGHSPGSVCLHVGENLFTGDTLFAGTCGRTDFPGGDHDEILRSLARLSLLDEHTKVWPGHEEGTNILREKTRNPFMREALQ